MKQVPEARFLGNMGKISLLGKNRTENQAVIWALFLQDKGASFHQQYNYQKLDTIWDSNIDYI